MKPCFQGPRTAGNKETGTRCSQSQPREGGLSGWALGAGVLAHLPADADGGLWTGPAALGGGQSGPGPGGRAAEGVDTAQGGRLFGKDRVPPGV